MRRAPATCCGNQGRPGTTRLRGGAPGDCVEAFDTVTLVAGVTGLLLVAGAVRVLTDRLRIPYTVALVLVGVVLGEVLRRTLPEFGSFAELPMASDVILF